MPTPRLGLRLTVDTSGAAGGGGGGGSSAAPAPAPAPPPPPATALHCALQAQAQAQAFASPLVEPKYGDFVLLAQLGRGSTSVVHRARHLPSGAEYALKAVPLPGDEERRAGFLREVRALQASCSGMIACHGFFLHEDSVHLVLQLMEGGSLEALVRARGALPERAAAALAYQLLWCLARLRHAHLLHRDVKPSNVLLTPSGAVRLGDAGLAKDTPSLAQAHSFVGTFAYMAPERLLQGPYAFPADVYGAGLSVLQAALGREPLAGAGGAFMDVLVAVMEAPALGVPPDGTPLPAPPAGGPPPPPLRLSPDFRALLDACLQRDPAARPTAEAALQLPLFAAHGIAGRADSEAILRAFMGGGSGGGGGSSRPPGEQRARLELI
jgi:serine/threonine protein kinase